MALDLDWNGMFVPTKPLLEIIIRGSAIYLGLFALLRIVLKRQASGLSITDMLVIVLLADAAQNGMADDYQSISEGWLLVGTILSWAYALDWLEFHSPWFAQLVSAPPLRLVREGSLIRSAMRAELVTEDEICTAMREAGIENLAEVKEAYIEPNGHITVIKSQ